MKNKELAGEIDSLIQTSAAWNPLEREMFILEYLNTWLHDKPDDVVRWVDDYITRAYPGWDNHPTFRTIHEYLEGNLALRAMSKSIYTWGKDLLDLQ